jgi:hypothetical protein
MSVIFSMKKTSTSLWHIKGANVLWCDTPEFCLWNARTNGLSILTLQKLHPHTSSNCSTLGLEGVGATELRHRYPHKLVSHFSLVLKFSIPIVFALAVLDGYANKKGLIYFFVGGEAIARFF